MDETLLQCSKKTTFCFFYVPVTTEQSPSADEDHVIWLKAATLRSRINFETLEV